MSGERSEDDERPLDLDESTRLLLRTSPAGFVAERKRLAAAAVERGGHDVAATILALRKPSMAAWALNVLSARHPELLDELMRLGSTLGEAQHAGDAALLRTLGTERRSLVARAVTATIDAAAEQEATLSSGVVEAVRQSIQAASADADVAARLASGRLAEALTSSGAAWGGAAAESADRQAADTSTPAGVGDDAATGAEPDDDRRRRLRARLDAAEHEAEVTSAAKEAADGLLAETISREAELLRDREDLARRLDELDADLADTARERARRQRDSDRTGREFDAAEDAVERLRVALDG
ncbi:MAG TPA: hypothetical protein VNJ54_08170 [Plantibacter sp.]|uniref:hypothetical protein n=1 Tax=unclassified Plantibacter TaxID=2624265 RepID=UPI002CC453BD|nr:hypothetical protein [Plantibacter sp.]